MKAGAFTPAILAELLDTSCRFDRSMKAGAFTPAIPGVLLWDTAARKLAQ